MVVELRMGDYDVGLPIRRLWWVLVEWSAATYPYEWRTSMLDPNHGWVSKRGFAPNGFRLTIRDSPDGA